MSRVSQGAVFGDRGVDLDVVPFQAVGMDAFAEVFGAAWGFAVDDRLRHAIASDVGPERPWGACLGDGRLVGTAMSFAMELTVPGGAQVPMAGVSYVAVHPLHRRRGVLRALMHRQLSDLRERRVPVAGLGASEAGIYGRFGYGPATWDSSWTLERGAIPAMDVDGGRCSLELVDAELAREVFPAVHDDARRHRIGDVRTYPGRWDDIIGEKDSDGAQLLLCREDGRPTGCAVYRLQRPERYSSHATVVVEHLSTTTDAAYRRLWTYLDNLDLTDRVVARGRPEHEPVHWLLTDRRTLTVTGVQDHLWLRLVDVSQALARRRYAVEGRLTLTVSDPFCSWNAGSWLLSGGPEGATCQRVDDPTGVPGPALTLDVAALASLYLGGVPATRLAESGTIAGDAFSLAAADRLFGGGIEPWCSTEF